jgi:hypothetical protein
MMGELLFDDPWTIDSAQFPVEGTRRDKLVFLLHYAVLAPSILGTEPWLFHVADDAVLLRADLARKLPITDPKGRELVISCAAALFNFRVAAASYGHELSVTTFPDERRPEIVAKVKLQGKTATPDEVQLRDAITKRRTHRGVFANRPLPAGLANKLTSAARREGAVLSFPHDPEDRWNILRLASEARRTQLASSAYRRELLDWVKRRLVEARDRDSEARQRIGVELSGASGRTPEPLNRPELDVPTTAGLTRMLVDSSHDRGAASGSPLLALLTTEADSKADWLVAGQSLQRVLLAAAAEGVSASYVNAPIETNRLRQQVARAFKVKGSPQIMLQMGIGRGRLPTPRRPMSEVVKSEDEG